jgi:hypothetical protein
MVDVIAGDALNTGLVLNGADITNAGLGGSRRGDPSVTWLSTTTFDAVTTLQSGVTVLTHGVNAKLNTFFMTQYTLSSLTYLNASGQMLVEITNLNIVRNATLPFLVTNLGFFNSDDSVLGNRFADTLVLGAGDDNGSAWQ